MTEFINAIDTWPKVLVAIVLISAIAAVMWRLIKGFLG